MTLLPSDYQKKYKDRIAEYESPMFYKFDFYRYRDPKRKRGLIEKIETSFILCEDQGRKEFDIKEFGKDVPKDVGYLVIHRYHKDPQNDSEEEQKLTDLSFYSQSSRYYNQQDCVFRHQKNKKGSSAKKYLKRFENTYVDAIKKHMHLKDPIGKCYMKSQERAYTCYWNSYSAIHLETLLYLNQNPDQTRSETSVKLPSGMFYQEENGEFLYTEDPKTITKLLPTKKSPPEKTTFIYIQQ